MSIKYFIGNIPVLHDDKPEQFGYSEQAMERRNAFLLRRQVYDRETALHQDEPAVLRMAYCLSAYLGEKEIIFEDDVLAGFYLYANLAHTSSNAEGEIFLAQRDGVARSEEDRKALSELLKYTSIAVCNRVPAGHVIAGYDRVLKCGLGGLICEAQTAMAAQGETPFRKAAEIVCRAVSRFIRRYGERASQLQLAAADERSRRNYGRIAHACDWVAEQPPRDFFEAMQLVCLVHEVILTEQNSGSLSLGRFDKYMAPYYERDKAAGKLDMDGAAEIVESFFRKMAATPRAFQNLTLGGYDSADGYCCNDLTRIALRTSRKVRKDQPLISLRWHPTMPADLWEDILDLVTAGIGFPALFNDEVCVPAKTRYGLSREDAEQYSIVGCVELSAGGKEYSHTEGLRINWAKVLEFMLNDGSCMLTGETFQMAEHHALSDIHSFAEFFAWFKKELHHFTDTAIRANNLLDKNFSNYWPSPFLSATMENCIQSSKDVTSGGTKYNNSSINAAGMANTVDSLLVIQRIVFEEKRFTLQQLADMMKRNFEGDEHTRLMIYNRCERFGSDSTAAEMMADLADDFYTFISQYGTPRGGQWQLGFYSVDWHAIMGEKTGATADGRKKGISLANAMSPVQGTEKHGPTEVIQAITRVDNTYFGNGMVLDLKFHPQFFAPPSHRAAFRQLVETYFEMGGMEMQFNVIDRETLLNAQRNPEQYRDLIVRVSGFSAYFTTLSATVQNEIIARTEFSEI